MSNKIQYTNEQMRGDLQEIIRQMTSEGFAPDVVVGIARGGLVPATMLSHYLGKSLMVINYSLRDNKVTQVSEVNDLIQLIKKDHRILIVDDICDSGETLAKVALELTESRELRGGYNINYDGWEDRVKTAVLWNNISQDKFTADYVGREIVRAEDERWVIFPYEEWWKA